jgi:predicted glycoside hydrolase/deacetylase ChbG (UPF0249 family)
MTIQLIINADDYGYFPCVSLGIIEAAHSGGLTATGILANSPDLIMQLKWLDAVPQLDLGVHLNLTSKQPLTQAMRDKLSLWRGDFPSAYEMSFMIAVGQINLTVVRDEWCAQIEACQSKKLLFLNSHEHIHMFPMLYPLALALAKEYSIPYVRMTRADWLKPFTPKGFARNALIQTMQIFNQRRRVTSQPIFLGLSHSGRLDYGVLSRIFSTLKKGQCYELMCHVGHFNVNEISDTKLIAQHDWDAELNLFKRPRIQELLDRYNICLSHYNDLAY